MITELREETVEGKLLGVSGLETPGHAKQLNERPFPQVMLEGGLLSEL